MLAKWLIDYPDIPRPDYRQVAQPRIPDLCCCVYFLWRQDECVYVGQTTNLKKRLTHHKKYLPGDRITWICFRKPELLRAEGFYIWLLHPRRNFRLKVQADDPAEKTPFPNRLHRATLQRHLDNKTIRP